MNKEDAQMIVAQLQQAHRVSVGFYHRILPTLDTVSSQLGLDFWYWEPLDTHVGCKSKTLPSTKSAWDFVPLFASGHVYCRVGRDTKTTPDDVGVMFWLCIEDSFLPENRLTRAHPDPIEMPQGKAVLRAYVYRPKEEYRKPFAVLWEEDADDDLEPGVFDWLSVSEHFEGVAIEWPLADVINDSQSMVEILKKYVGAAS